MYYLSRAPSRPASGRCPTQMGKGHALHAINETADNDYFQTENRLHTKMCTAYTGVHSSTNADTALYQAISTW
jgi:hypothetical protein